MLVIGAVLLFAGAVRELEGTAHDTGMLGMGLVVAGVAAIWIYASSRTRSDQIQFIEDHLESCAGGA
jgi:molybdopterin synthase catalytic subunit